MTLIPNLRRFLAPGRTAAIAFTLGLPTCGLFAQAFTITEPTVTTCTGAFLDSGGEGASGYGNDENFVSTICSDQPGQSISLTWITFNLSTAGPSPGDVLTIYDGPDVSAPVIGTYVGTNSPGIVSASFGNTSGCITVQFTSNSTGTGIFAATISCYVPCQPPMAVASMGAALPNLICQDEPVAFDASSSYAAPGRTITSYAWDFDDGSTDNTSGAAVSHSWHEAGEYVVQLLVTDDIGCESTNRVDLQNWVSTTPVFDLTGPQEICLGHSATITGNAEAVTWSDLPHVDFGDGVELPDDVGSTFSSDITYTIFEPGAALTNIDQLLSLCVDMEHSYMGDLVINITCPNGQTTVLHQQNGGGIFLGDANDEDDVDPIPGTCWQYCWSPSATNGTWAENADAGNTVLASQGASLAPGTYESLQPMTNLVGCPLNGTWTFNVTDLWGADNGFLCSWNIDFDPALYPDLTQYTPVLGLSTPDSSFWSGPAFTASPNDHLVGTVTPSAPGTYEYVFAVTDNFGCTYRDTTTVNVAEPPTASYTATPPSPQLPGVTALFEDTSDGGSSPVNGWHWSFGEGSTANGASASITYPEPGLYPVTLVVTNTQGCVDSLTTIYRVIPGDVVVPNVFSPNGDGHNDRLEFGNLEFYSNAHLQVYNRWGKVVYESSNYKNTWAATDMSAGTYFFILHLGDDGREWAGHVTLVR